jgi:hypothetical protein
MALSPERHDHRDEGEPEAGLTVILWLIAAWLGLVDLVMWFVRSVFGT